MRRCKRFGTVIYPIDFGWRWPLNNSELPSKIQPAMSDLPTDSRDSGGSIWTIYRYPELYPNSWVLRERELLPARRTDVYYVLSSLEEARTAVPPNRANIGRAKNDDLVIFESWI